MGNVRAASAKLRFRSNLARCRPMLCRLGPMLAKLQACFCRSRPGSAEICPTFVGLRPPISTDHAAERSRFRRHLAEFWSNLVEFGQDYFDRNRTHSVESGTSLPNSAQSGRSPTIVRQISLIPCRICPKHARKLAKLGPNRPNRPKRGRHRTKFDRDRNLAVAAWTCPDLSPWGTGL